MSVTPTVAKDLGALARPVGVSSPLSWLVVKNSLPKQTLRMLLASLLVVGQVPAAYANMVLSNAIVHFEKGSAARQDIEISNVGEEPLYVQIEPHIVLNPGTAQEERVLIKNPREHGLLVTPSRMVLAPGTAKSMRLVKLPMPDDPEGERERIYRVSARPVVGDVTAQQSGLKVLIGYEVLAIVYPKNPEPDLLIERNGTLLTAQNRGNTNVLLQEGFQCETPEQPLEECAQVRGKRMYPGLSWSVDLERDLPVRFFQSVGTRNYVETYD